MKLPSLFNPSNDMALAANLRQYFPPRHIQQMEDDLRDLARFWDEGPWGWSLAAKQRYLRMGVPENELPSDAWLAKVRALSSREFGVRCYQGLDGIEGLVPCRARFCTSLDEVRLFLIQFPLFMVKAPWSSSGRGNMVVGSRPVDKTIERRMERIIREQGGVVVEPFYQDKVLDFAMEFSVTDSGADFVGYSVFFADETGYYGGNLVKSQDELLRLIDLPRPLLEELIDYHRHVLSPLPYRGPVGIDMMRLGDGRVHPCVEVNFRMTMGLLALLLYERGVREDQWLTPYRPQGFTAGIRGGCLCISTP